MIMMITMTVMVTMIMRLEMIIDHEDPDDDYCHKKVVITC